jgi:hypothetical protein
MNDLRLDLDNEARRIILSRHLPNEDPWDTRTHWFDVVLLKNHLMFFLKARGVPWNIAQIEARDAVFRSTKDRLARIESERLSMAAPSIRIDDSTI